MCNDIYHFIECKFIKKYHQPLSHFQIHTDFLNLQFRPLYEKKLKVTALILAFLRPDFPVIILFM